MSATGGFWGQALPLALGVFAVFLAFATALPLVDANAWWVRIFDFPRAQLAALMVVALAGYAGLWYCRRFSGVEYALSILVALSLLWQVYRILPYTPLFAFEVKNSRKEEESTRLSILISNVLYENRDVAALLELIEETDPDVVLLTEPSAWWQGQLEGLKERYPHTLLQAQENKYGMLLYSRLELIDPAVRFLVEPSVPSMRLGLRLRSGDAVTLYGLHPRPPGLKRPGSEEREDSDKRDAELILVAKEVEQRPGEPVVVAGDFNDVAWSHTTHLFQRIGGLLDPRVGRGLFTTFDVRKPLLRYPLDHVFVSDQFRLTELRRLRDIGSDHFPMLVVLDYDPSGAAAHDEPEPDAGDQKKAAEAIEEGR